MRCYLFGLASLFLGKMIILLMQGIFYKQVDTLSCYLLNFLLLLVQYVMAAASMYLCTST
jgi:hypothetical protein